MGRDHGFTLLEVLVAFIIAALALAMLFSGSLTALALVQGGASYEEAVARARSRLALEAVALVPGDRAGDDREGYRWRVSVHPAEQFRSGGAAEPGSGTSTTFLLYTVGVEVSWGSRGRERAVRLDTKRIQIVRASQR